MLHFVGRTGHICFKNWIKFFVKKIILASCSRKKIVQNFIHFDICTIAIWSNDQVLRNHNIYQTYAWMNIVVWFKIFDCLLRSDLIWCNGIIPNMRFWKRIFQSIGKGQQFHWWLILFQLQFIRSNIAWIIGMEVSTVDTNRDWDRYFVGVKY
jgi:hypothetical protein